jgi:dethiobiotin synthase
MKLFVTGTDTNVGKTLVCSWLCLHLQADYWKPIQCGLIPNTDRQTVAALSGMRTHPETYRLQLAASPHLAAARENITIHTADCQPPTADRLIIEGAGGVLVPLNKSARMIDLMTQFNCPIVLVARSTLGTINHTCLSLQALRARNIPVLGVILCGEPNADNRAAIENYGDVEVLAEFPQLQQINEAALQSYPLPSRLLERLRALQ